MRKIIFQMMVSLDGYFEGKYNELDWHVWDEEMNGYARQLMNNADTILFGRVTYQMMEKFWPTPIADAEDADIANKMNSYKKYVFSTTLAVVNWNNTTLVTKDTISTLQSLKQQEGKDILIFGSSDLVVSLLPHQLIDEFQIIVNPVVLGNGKQLFEGITAPLKFKLNNSRSFISGNVLLNYTI